MPHQDSTDGPRFKQIMIQPARLRLFRIKVEDVLAGFLGLVHGRIGTLRERLLILAIIRVDADADTGRHLALLARYAVWLGHDVDDLAGHGFHQGPVLYFWKHHHEFIAGNPLHQVAFTQAGLQPSRHLAQQLITRIMTQVIVYDLEVIRIQKQYGQAPLPAMGLVDGLPQQPAEQAAVRQLQVGSAHFLGGRELLLRRQANKHTDGKSVELTNTDITLDSIQR